MILVLSVYTNLNYHLASILNASFGLPKEEEKIVQVPESIDKKRVVGFLENGKRFPLNS